MQKFTVLAALGAFAISPSATAAPGVGEKVYPATVEKGVSEVEARYGRLTGGPDKGEDGLVLEFAHGFTDHVYGAVLAEFEREPGGSRKLEAIALESVVNVARIEPLGLDVGLYGEYEAVRDGNDKVETKLLLQHKRGPFDGRLNLIAEKSLGGGEPVEFGYALSADWEAFDEIRLGGAAFGDFGSARSFRLGGEHFAGPIVKAEIEHFGPGELEIETGYLFALGDARDDANGQLRLNLEYEFRF
ncbi:hypothetical protein [Sphingomonas jaspsi]|uniref:hypothetical protein n=1 Tax=Sphingomonas jaspsi TaxID=392409 RepID=UPI0004B9CF40|nr:hypothetical protein [Sphingomonas jaspsi]